MYIVLVVQSLIISEKIRRFTHPAPIGALVFLIFLHTKTLSLKVLLPPTFTRRPVNQRAQEKEDILVQCEVDGHPDPEIHWFKNGDKIIESEYFQVWMENEYFSLPTVNNQKAFINSFVCVVSL